MALDKSDYGWLGLAGRVCVVTGAASGIGAAVARAAARAGALLAFALRRVSRLPRWLSVIASETLFLYVSHVWLLYAAHVGVRALFGSTLTPGQALVVAVILFVFCLGGALGYRFFARGPRPSRPPR